MTKFLKQFRPFVMSIDKIVTNLNKSKLFAGFIVLCINIGSRFVNFRLSTSIENYLKYTFNRNLLVFCISWMGSRDIYLSLVVTVIFSIFADLLFNEQSAYCILPTTFTEAYQNMQPTEDEINKAKDVLRKSGQETFTLNNDSAFHESSNASDSWTGAGRNEVSGREWSTFRSNPIQ